MIYVDEDALVCDLAETYGIYEYRQLPLDRVAVFACGLSDDSRIKRRLTGQAVGIETFLLASAVDRLSFLVWAKTKDGQHNQNRPQSLVELLMGTVKEKEELVFDSGEDFERAKAELLRKIGGEVIGD